MAHPRRPRATNPLNRRDRHAVTIVDENNTSTVGHRLEPGGRSPHRPPLLSDAMLWRDIAVGLVVAILGMLLALSAVRAEVTQTRIVQPVVGLHQAAAVTAAKPLPTPSL